MRYDLAPPPEVRDLGLFETKRAIGPNVKAIGGWKLDHSRESIRCCYRLTGTPAMTPNTELPLWALTINRPTPTTKFFSAWINNGPRAKEVLLGPCTGWCDAIRQVAEHAPFIEEMARDAQNVYGWINAGQWCLITPFRIVYPFSDRREPNAIYSPFTLPEGHVFDADSDGAVACCHGLNAGEGRRIAKDAKANAFLMRVNHGQGFDAGVTYRLYHRQDMAQYDLWGIDDWRGRIIAGTRDL